MAGDPGAPSRWRWLSERVFASTLMRYVFALAMTAGAFGLRMLVSPWTGRGAPFVLFFGATLVTSLFVGAGPGLVALLAGLPLAALRFSIPGGATPSQAVFQTVLYFVDGLVIVYLSRRTRLAQEHLQGFNRDLAEAATSIRQSEEQLRLMFEEAPIGVALVSLEGRFRRVNRALCDILGYSPEELELLTFLDITPPEDLKESLALGARVRRGEVPKYRLEKRYIRKDGTFVTISVNAGVVRDREGRPLHYIAQIEDITERKRAEQAMRFSEAKFSGIVSISADAIISLDERQCITVFNTGAERIFGYSRDEVLGAPLELLIPERVRDRHREDVARFAFGSVTARRMGEGPASVTGRRKNGQEFPAEASISNLSVGDTKILNVVLRDITERDRLEREQRILAEVGVALAASLDYELTLAAVAGIAVRDFADWCLVEIADESDGLRRLKVVSADSSKVAVAAELERFPLDRQRPYLMKSVVESRHPLLIPRCQAVHIEAAAQSPEHLRALRALEATSLISVPLLLREELLGTLTFISSRASRVYGPEELRLATALAERSALAIEHARLYRAALHATGMRDQVLGVVAHDLRNPLSAIGLHAAALRRPKGEPERRDQRHKLAIERATARMNRLIQDLLDVVVLEAGRLTVERVPLSPGELVRDAADVQQALATASAIDLRVEAAADAGEIFGDRDRLLQVFENLIGNALKFTEGGGRVTVGVGPGETGALFWVADSGRGMTRDECARIFDRFWQASGRPGRLGAGLGLPITKGIVEAHGGRIWVESAPGQGSIFFFSIPSVPALEGRSAEPHPALH
jgi:PAS domain S-box-containing protein